MENYFSFAVIQNNLSASSEFHRGEIIRSHPQNIFVQRPKIPSAQSEVVKLRRELALHFLLQISLIVNLRSEFFLIIFDTAK